jgi:hypothetical protein
MARRRKGQLTLRALVMAMPHGSAFLWLLAALVGVGGLARRRWVWKLLWRLVSGAHLDGKVRTDAGWWVPGVKRVGSGGPVGRWCYRPRIQRAGIRWAVLAVVVAGLVGLAIRPAIVAGAAVVAGVGLAAWLGWRTWRTVRHFRHRRRYVVPLWRVLARVIGVAPTTRPEEHLEIPLDFATNEHAAVVVRMADGFEVTATSRKKVTETVAAKLGIAVGDLDADYQLVGTPTATFRIAPRPPDAVAWDALLPLVEKATDTAPVIGVGPRGQTVAIDLDAESPHVLISMGTGGGKSVLARTIVAQGMHRGGFTVVLDLKRHSHAWLKGAPNVLYCRDVADMHETLIFLAREGDARNLSADEQEGEFHGTRIFVVAEEMNATIHRLTKYWRQIRSPGMPVVSPAVDALGDLLFMGRAVRMHVIAIAQMATARALGGPEQRENFSARILGRYTQNAWRMLVPEVTPIPRSSRHRGRVQVVLAGVARETQVGFLTDAQAREWATSGEVTRAPFLTGWPDGAPAVTVTHRPTADTAPSNVVDLHKRSGSDPQSDVPEMSGLRLVTDDGEEPVTLIDAVGQEIILLSLEAARTARKRDPEFPPARGRRGRELLYAPEELARWERNRERAGTR